MCSTFFTHLPFFSFFNINSAKKKDTTPRKHKTLICKSQIYYSELHSRLDTLNGLKCKNLEYQSCSSAFLLSYSIWNPYFGQGRMEILTLKYRLLRKILGHKQFYSQQILHHDNDFFLKISQLRKLQIICQAFKKVLEHKYTSSYKEDMIKIPDWTETDLNWTR